VTRQRLDKALVERDIARSRSHAKELIENDRVRVDGFPAEKPSTLVEHDDHLTLEGDEYPWVGRGGKKIWPFIDRGWLDPNGEVAIDVGASTGGFTQALLRAGAKGVHAVDVGYGQLDYELRQDSRVTVHDRYNFRYAEPDDFDPDPVVFTMDVSFISTLKLLDALNAVTANSARGLCLVKPQFEAEPDENDDGIVTRDSVVKRVLREIVEGWSKMGWGTRAVAPAPLTGQEGNQEFVALFDRDDSDAGPDQVMIDDLVDEQRVWHAESVEDEARIDRDDPAGEESSRA
jgi:23S rRNA (cytidine1920-2'-O)/16S rRNA (cytidine1409-2'-O)-methyltransferase